MADIERVRPCPGVLPFADRRHDSAPAVSWRTLDRQLAGVIQRRGRAGDKWPWREGGPALTTMANVYQQTARASDVGRADLREPAWLGDECYCLSPREARLIVGLLSVYEAKWGGLADCQSSVAVALRVGDERTLRNLLWGTTWTSAAGEKRRRPGLVERGFVTAVQLYKPGRPDGRPSDMHWLLLRIGPTIERAALWAALGKDWTGRAPRHSGWSKGSARAVINGLRSRVCSERYHAAGVAWARRSRPPGQAPDREAIGAALENWAPPASSSSPPGNRAHVELADETGHAAELEQAARKPGAAELEPPIGELVDLGEVSAAFVKLRSDRADTERLAALEQARRECREIRREHGAEIDAANEHFVNESKKRATPGIDPSPPATEPPWNPPTPPPPTPPPPATSTGFDSQSTPRCLPSQDTRPPPAGVARPHWSGPNSTKPHSGPRGSTSPASNWSESVSDNPAPGAPRSSGPLGRLGGSGGSVAPPPKGSPTGNVPPLSRRPDFIRRTAKTRGAVRSEGVSLRPSSQASGGAPPPPVCLPDAVRVRLTPDEQRSIDRLCKLDPQLGAQVVRLAIDRFGTVDHGDTSTDPTDPTDD
jgi:hypothetical protein